MEAIRDSVVYSGFWRRFAATAIDGFILMIPSIGLNMVIPFSGAFLPILYKCVFESSPLQATPGKAVIGLVVVSENGGRITFKQSLIRYLASILSGVMMGVGYFISVFTARRQTLHDLIAETLVIDRPSAPANFFSIWLDEVKKLLGLLDQTAPRPAPVDTDATEPIVNPHYSTSSGAQSDLNPSNPSNPLNDPILAIEQLHKLFQAGALTEEEFKTKKADILSKI